EYAQAVIDEIKKPANMEKIKELALSQIEEGNDSEDVSALKALLAKYNASTVEEFDAHAGEDIHALQKKIWLYSGIMLLSLILFLIAWWALRNETSLHKPL